MIFHRFEEEGLAHYSYVVGDEEHGVATVVDPKRDADDYIDWIEAKGLELTGVIETHLHADFVSGARELADIKDVPHYLSELDSGEKYEALYDHVPVEDGDTIEIGSLTFQAVHTPGHTPEHLSFLLYAGAPDQTDPVKLFSGDFLFVQSLGRPDLIGEDAKNRLANMLYESVQRVKESDWPDDLQVHPAHGAGSLCGAGLSEDPSSTFGDERTDNPYFQIVDRETFKKKVFDALGDFPPYYPRMKDVNSEGAPYVLPIERPSSLPLKDFKEGLNETGKNIILDLRDREMFGRGHIPGSYSLPLSSQINQWGPWVLNYDTPIYFVGPADFGGPEMEDAYRSLLRVGLDEVRGYLEGGYPTWENNEKYVQTFRELEPEQLHKELERDRPPIVLDVRTEEEFAEEHIPGSGTSWSGSSRIDSTNFHGTGIGKSLRSVRPAIDRVSRGASFSGRDTKTWVTYEEAFPAGKGPNLELHPIHRNIRSFDGYHYSHKDVLTHDHGRRIR